MSRFLPSMLAAALLSTSLIACRSDSNTSTPDGNTPTTDGTTPGGAVSIQDVQSDTMPKGTQVKLEGVVVTAIDSFGAKTGNFWVQEPEGGPFSGVEVFGAALADVAALKVGDIVTIDGAEKDEFALTADTSGRTVTELKPLTGGMLTVTKTGSGTAPAPAMVDALAIGKLGPGMAQDAEWEKWEGVLITLTNVSQTGPVRQIGSGTGADPTFQKFPVTGNVQVESSLAMFPMGIDVASCYTSITGIGDYFFDYLLLPRDTAEIVTSASAASCPAPENTPTACGDGVDNDGNGFKDCMDNACLAVPACHTTTTIPMIQAGAVTGTVEIDNVYVVALNFSKKNLWVAQSLQAAPNEGLYVIHGVALDANVVPGAKVNILGKVNEYNNDMNGSTLTELDTTTITVVAPPGAGAGGQPVPASGQMASALTAPTTGEPYESVLVRLNNVKLTKQPDATMFYVGEAQQGGVTFLTDDDILRTTDPVGTCYSSVVGIWTYQVFSNAYGLLPVSVTPGGTCP